MGPEPKSRMQAGRDNPGHPALLVASMGPEPKSRMQGWVRNRAPCLR